MQSYIYRVPVMFVNCAYLEVTYTNFKILKLMRFLITVWWVRSGAQERERERV